MLGVKQGGQDKWGLCGPLVSLGESVYQVTLQSRRSDMLRWQKMQGLSWESQNHTLAQY